MTIGRVTTEQELENFIRERLALPVNLQTNLAYLLSGTMWGAGSPETVVSAAVGTLYRRTDGGAGTTLYVKESGSGNTGWVAK